VTRWEREDHLVRVAGIRHDQVNRLVTAGLTTLTALAQARPDTRVPKIPAATLEALHDQAALQFESQRAGKIAYLELADRRRPRICGAAATPLGDVILDLEGHPFSSRRADSRFCLVSSRRTEISPDTMHPGHTITPESVEPLKTLSILFMPACAPSGSPRVPFRRL
jgi:predicted RecB family nuclease